MYNDKRRIGAFCESASDKDKCFPYSILSKQQQQQHRLQPSLPQAAIVAGSSHPFRNHPTPGLALSNGVPSNVHHLAAPSESPFYANAMVTDVGICFSMSNVNLNSDFPPYMGHPSLSVLGKGYNDAPSPPMPTKYRMSPPVLKPRNAPPPPTSLHHPNPYVSAASTAIPYNPYYFAHPKIPIKIYNNHTYPYLPAPATSSSTASVATAYGQQLNNYYSAYPMAALPTPATTPPDNYHLLNTGGKRRQNAKKTLLNSQYYDICMTKCSSAMQAAFLDSTPDPIAPASSRPDSPISVDMADPSEEGEFVEDDQPHDFSLKTRSAAAIEDSDPISQSPPMEVDPAEIESMEVVAVVECSRKAAPPKKKWIRHYLKDEPLVNGHSTAPPLVVISTNGNSQKHHPALTIDLSTKSSSHYHPHHRLSSTPPSSGCSSSSSTLTISPVDDSQSSLNLSSGSSGYITSHSANSSTVRLSGAGSVDPDCDQLLIDQNVFSSSSSSSSSHGSNSSPLPHDLVIVQQQSQLGHLVTGVGAGQLTSTATLLGQVPTGGRRRTTSSNSNGVGTREVHNKLEKNRRAHLKECFEQLKKQLTLQPDEKKTSNLSILHAAIRHIQLLKRKEREYEHEMERLAKEKIAAQNRIVLLKRELSQWGDVDFSRLAPDTDAIPNGSSGIAVNVSATSNGGVAQPSDRDLLNEPSGILPGRNGIQYSSSSSLSSVATTASIGNLPLQTTISPVLIAASSPSRASPPTACLSTSVVRNSSPPAATSGMAMPLSLTTKSSMADTTHNGPSPLKTTTGLPNGLNLTAISNGIIGNTCSPSSSSTIGNGINGASLPLIVGANNLSQSQLFTPVTTILTTGNGAAIQTLPLNLNVAASTGSNVQHQHAASSSTLTSNGVNGLVTSTASGLQIIGTTANGATVPAGLVSSTTGKELVNGHNASKNGLRTSDGNKIEIIATQTTAGSALEPPATKVIKLVNGNTLEKVMLSQAFQQGGIVVSPIQLLTSTQGLRVIQQAPNGLATIELSSPSNVQSQSSQVHRATGGNTISNSNNTNPSHLSSQPSSHHHHHLPTGAQLHKLLLSSTPNGTTATLNGLTSTTTGTVVSTTSITPELARLPGGAELNILPAGTNGTTTALPLYRTAAGSQGKLTFVNAISTGNGAGLTLKGADSVAPGTGRTAVHVVTPIQTSSAAQLSGMTPVVVSRYHEHQDKVVKTVGQSPSGLPLIAATPNAHYLSTVLKPTAMVTSQTSSAPLTSTPNLVLVNSSGSISNNNQTPPPTAPPASITSKGTTIGEVTAIAI